MKLSLFADDMILYIENPKDSIRKLLELIVNLAKLQDTKSIHRNHLHFYILTILFIIAWTWKQPKCSSADEWIRKLVHIHNGVLLSH